MEDNWIKAIKFVLDHEGGYVNDPNDPGKATKFGISKKSYPHLKIEDLTEDMAKSIYHRDFWEPLAGTLNWPFDVLVFDTAVNCGAFNAARFLENPDVKVWTDYLFRRIQYYCSLKPSLRAIYLTGWINRVVDLYKFIQKEDHP